MTPITALAQPRELDVVEVIETGHALPCGSRGTVVDVPGPGFVTVEVSDEHGRTRAIASVPVSAVRVVWASARQVEAAARRMARGPAPPGDAAS